MNGRLLALIVGAATIVLILIGAVAPNPSALANAGGVSLANNQSTSEAALRTLGDAVHAQAWAKAYDSLANKAQFTQPQFMADMMGYYPNLRTYSGLDTFEISPGHAGDADAE